MVWFNAIYNSYLIATKELKRESLKTHTIYSKTFEGKTCVFRVENGYSLENFRGSMLVD